MNKKGIIIISSAIAAVLAISALVYYKNQNSNKSPVVPSATVTPTFIVSSPTPSASATPTASPKAVPSPSVTAVYKTETIKDYNVAFNIPETWKKVSGYDNRYEGSDGFVQLTAFSGYGLTLKEAADIQINHELKPFGDNPQIKNTTVDSQEAVIITSSNNNDPKAQSALLVKLPKALTISNTPYYYLLVWADKAHIDNVANGIVFLDESK